MKNIQVKILNKDHIEHMEKMAAFTARLTQKGHTIKNMDDLEALYDKPYKSLEPFCTLPHPAIQKFGAIDIAIVGASRRFLAQITRHQNEVKFMSASIQYSDYSNDANFVIPESFSEEDKHLYLEACKTSLKAYSELSGAKDDAGYILPHGLRNVLIVSATPYQWKHMINQRVCRRNTEETAYIMKLIWKELDQFEIFKYGMGPFCVSGPCLEGKMTCGRKFDVSEIN